MRILRKIYSTVLPVVKNYYIMVTLIFAVWLLFFDNNNLIGRFENRRELQELLLQKNYYRGEIDKNRKMYQSLKTDLNRIEEYARTKYLMKKDNETIFLIVKEEDK